MGAIANFTSQCVRFLALQPHSRAKFHWRNIRCGSAVDDLEEQPHSRRVRVRHPNQPAGDSYAAILEHTSLREKSKRIAH